MVQWNNGSMGGVTFAIKIATTLSAVSVADSKSLYFSNWLYMIQSEMIKPIIYFNMGKVLKIFHADLYMIIPTPQHLTCILEQSPPLTL